MNSEGFVKPENQVKIVVVMFHFFLLQKLFSDETKTCYVSPCMLLLLLYFIASLMGVKTFKLTFNSPQSDFCFYLHFNLPKMGGFSIGFTLKLPFASSLSSMMQVNFKVEREKKIFF